MKGNFSAEEGRYANIGKKMKDTAVAAEIFGSIIAIGYGIFLFIDENILGAIIAIALGCGIAAYTSMILYGFGKLIEDVGTIASACAVGNSVGEQSVVSNEIGLPKWANTGRGNVDSLPNGKWKCSGCGKINESYTGTCSCGQQK